MTYRLPAPGPLPALLQRKADIAPAEPSLAVEIPQQLRLHIPPLLKKVVLDDSTQVGGCMSMPGRDWQWLVGWQAEAARQGTFCC